VTYEVPLTLATGDNQHVLDVHAGVSGSLEVAVARTTPTTIVRATFVDADGARVEAVSGPLENGRIRLDGLRPGQWARSLANCCAAQQFAYAKGPRNKRPWPTAAPPARLATKPLVAAMAAMGSLRDDVRHAEARHGARGRGDERALLTCHETTARAAGRTRGARGAFTGRSR
jgi:hypothetical protein